MTHTVLKPMEMMIQEPKHQEGIYVEFNKLKDQDCKG